MQMNFKTTTSSSIILGGYGGFSYKTTNLFIMIIKVQIWFLFFKTVIEKVFKDIDNTILVFSENYLYSMNLVFFIFSVFF